MPPNDEYKQILALITRVERDIDRQQKEQDRRIGALEKPVLLGTDSTPPMSVSIQLNKQEIKALRHLVDHVTASPPPQQGFWPQLLTAVIAPFKAFAAARPLTQLIVLVIALFFGLVLTDGGREIIAGAFGGAAEALEQMDEDQP